VKQHPPGFIDDARAQSQSQSQSQPQYQSQFQSLSPVPGQVNQPVSQSVRHAQGIAERRLWFRRPSTGNCNCNGRSRKKPTQKAQWDAPRINGRFVPLLAIAVV